MRFADGRQAAQDDEAGLRSGRGPMLVITGSQVSSGGPDDREDVRLSVWDMALAAARASRGDLLVAKPGDCTPPGFALDGDAIQAAARRAQPCWPGPGS